MEDDKKTNLLIIIISIIIVIVLVILLLPNGKSNKNTILEVYTEDTVFVGDSGTINVTTDDEKVKVIYKYGFLYSPSIIYRGSNISVPFKAQKAGTEEVNISSTNMTKTIFVNVCDDIKLLTNSISLNVGSSKTIDFGISNSCLAKYNIKIQDENIATFSNNTIYAKNVGITNLSITRGNTNLIYTIKVEPNEIKVDPISSTIKIGESVELEITSPNGSVNCQTDSDIISVSSGETSCTVTGKKAGTAIIKINSALLTTTASVKVIDTTVSSVTLSPNVIRLAKGGTYKLKAEIEPLEAENKNVTWSSANNKIAIVSSDGTINAINYGITNIIATSANGKKGIASVVVTENNLITNYDSSTLKYWIAKGGTYYDVTYIWVKDAYSQFKVAITEPKNSSSPTPRIPAKAEKIIDYMIKTNPSYSSKGFVIANASAMVSSSYGKNAPSSWYGTAQIPLILNNGNVIRDSSNERIAIDGNYYIYGMKKDGDLAYYNFNRSGITESDRAFNRELFQKIKSDGVLYTFGFDPVLVWNGQVMSSSNTPNIRQALCQVDKNNFIIVTNTNSTNKRDVGFSYKKLGEYFTSLGCRTAFNLDGGGSTCLYYKKSGSNYTKVDTTYSGRELSDMIYFVEK